MKQTLVDTLLCVICYCCMTLSLIKHEVGPRRRIGAFGRIVQAIENKPISDRLLLRVLFFAILAGLIYAGLSLNNQYLAKTPVNGGIITEGIIGIPRFVNPVLAVTRADQDLSALIYSGLMKIDTTGNLVPDVAESVTVSDDGTTYNVIIRNDVRFHDDTPLTARDVAFTIGLIQNADLKSPLRGNWSGVTVEEIGEYELNIVLDEPYTPFIENLTVGIVPRHIWNDLPVEQIPFSKRNTDPIGSGSFKIHKIIENDSGLIDEYELTRANDTVKLDGIHIRFFQTDTELVTALEKGIITASANIPLAAVKAFSENNDYMVITEPLPRLFAVFYNQNKSPALRDQAVRSALEIMTNRDQLVAETLFGNGVPSASSWSPDNFKVASTSSGSTTDTLAVATEILRGGGWQLSATGQWEKRIDGTLIPLTITIRTANSTLFEQTSAYLKTTWETLGVVVQVERYEQSDLLQSVIRPRDFEALLFGIDMNRSMDLYPFWHSSQREDPGLNIAQYANIEVDRLLAEARTEQSATTSSALYVAANTIITRERPALFLFVPTLTYITTSNIKTAPMTAIGKASERFANSSEWHVAEEDRWPMFR